MSSARKQPIVVDDSHWPLVVTILRDGAEDADIGMMLARYDAMLRRRDRFVALVDLGELTRPPGANQRKMIGEWSKQRDLELSHFSLGYAIIIPGMIVRGALTALLWIHRTAAPETVVADPPRALAWCIERLEQAYVPVGPRIRGYVHKRDAA